MKFLIYYLRTKKDRTAVTGALLAGLSAFFTFAGYEMIRSPAESVFLTYFAASQKPYALTAVPVVMALLIYIYGWTLSRLGPMRAMAASMFASIACFVIFYVLLIARPCPAIALTVFVFKEAYVVIISEQYWSYINSVLSSDESKIFNGPVAGLGAFGSLTGGWFVSHYVGFFKTDIYLLFSGICLIPAVFIFIMAYMKTGEPHASIEEISGKKGHVHLSLLWENKIVLLISMMIFFTQSVATLTDINFTSQVKQAISDKDLRTAFLGGFWMKVNILSFSMQFLFAPLILRKLKTKYVLVAIPFVHIITSVFAILNPGMFSAGIAFLLFKSMDYSIFRAAKETLYIPFSYDTRYRIKQVADAFTYRFAKGFISLALSVTQLMSRLSISMLPWFCAVFSGFWMSTALFIDQKENRQA